MTLTADNLIIIYAESTPNPETRKFVCNRYLLPDATLQFDNANQAARVSPLAEKLFEFEFVKAVFINNNYVTVTRKPDFDWFEIESVLKDWLKNYLEAGFPIVNAEKAQVETAQDARDTAITLKIKEILAQYVQPAVEQDGGAIQFKQFEQETGVLTVVLKGSCSGCPSSTITLKAGIENLLTRMVPEVKEVIADAN